MLCLGGSSSNAVELTVQYTPVKHDMVTIYGSVFNLESDRPTSHSKPVSNQYTHKIRDTRFERCQDKWNMQWCNL